MSTWCIIPFQNDGEQCKGGIIFIRCLNFVPYEAFLSQKFVLTTYSLLFLHLWYHSLRLVTRQITITLAWAILHTSAKFYSTTTSYLHPSEHFTHHKLYTHIIIHNILGARAGIAPRVKDQHTLCSAKGHTWTASPPTRHINIKVHASWMALA